MIQLWEACPEPDRHADPPPDNTPQAGELSLPSKQQAKQRDYLASVLGGWAGLEGRAH